MSTCVMFQGKYNTPDGAWRKSAAKTIIISEYEKESQNAAELQFIIFISERIIGPHITFPALNISITTLRSPVILKPGVNFKLQHDFRFRITKTYPKYSLIILYILCILNNPGFVTSKSVHKQFSRLPQRQKVDGSKGKLQTMAIKADNCANYFKLFQYFPSIISLAHTTNHYV